MTNTLTRIESNPQAIKTFLRRLGHPVCVMGMSPVGQAPARTIIYPVDLREPVGQILGLADEYHAVYCNLNPLRPELLEGTPTKPSGRVAFLADRMIARRSRLLIDVDAHAGEKADARQQADAIVDALGAPLIFADSGNGYGLIYPIDLPNDDRSTELIRGVLGGLKTKYPAVDTSCFNAGRWTRITGTLNRNSNGDRIPTQLIHA